MRESWRYVPIADRGLPPEEQTTFVLTPLIQGERLKVWDNGSWVHQGPTGDSVMMPRSYQQAYELCLQHIADVENFPAKVKNGAGIYEGTAKPFPVAGTQVEKLRYLDEFDDLVILEIGNEIRDRSTLDTAAKN
jgi:hypothetical protein